MTIKRHPISIPIPDGTFILKININLNLIFETTSLAYFNRYPNPYAKHVLSIDTIESYIDNQGQLCTTRLIVKTGRLPNFIKPILGNSLNSWIIEKL